MSMLCSPLRSFRLSVALWCALAVSLSPSHAIVDLDKDGYSDVWTSAYGTGLIPDADDDGDGRTNRQEHDEGTDPHDAGSMRPAATVQALAKKKVRVSWPSIAGKWHQLQVSFDGSTWSNLGAALSGDGRTQERVFTPATQYLTGGPLISRWLNLPGGDLQTLIGYAKNGTLAPTETGTLIDIETRQTSPDQNNFGQWVRGWIIPAVTGRYTFWIASDDAGALYLSPSADPAAKELIASVNGWTSFRQWTKYDTQKSTERTLKAGVPYYFEAYQREGAGGDHLSVAWTGSAIGTTQTIIAGSYVATDAETMGQKLAKGLTPTYRVLTFDRDSDGDGLSDWEETIAGLDPKNPKSVARTPDLQTITSTLASGNTITVGAEVSRGYEKEQTPLKFVFFRSGNINPVTATFSVSGTAQSGLDFAPVTGTISFDLGQTSAAVEIRPESDAQFETAESVTVTLNPGTGYAVGNPASATGLLDDAADLIYVATLRPIGKGSAAYGTVSLRVAGNKAFADLSLSFGNLSTQQMGAELYTLGAGGKINSVLSLPLGQIAVQRWDLAAAAGLTQAQIITALESGKLYARLTSERFPNGEAAGSFVRTWGWKNQRPPAAPGATLARARNDGEAARFLTQSTFGPTTAEIERVKKLGFAGWIAEQMKLPATKHLPYVQSRRAELLARSNNTDDGYQAPRQEAWWQASLAAPDQLRQRVAFALSEIIVVSDDGMLEGAHEGLTNWYDMLVDNAFGNFRNLLEETTLSPMMGQYLSMVRNQKPNPDTGSEPDENYAREIMQLFSIGLQMLNPDGSLALSSTGLPVPTYTQSDIVGLAHVFTGWGPAYDPAAPPNDLRGNFLYGQIDPLKRMMMYPSFHDTEAKRIVAGTIIPAGGTGEQDLKLAIDAIFKHPNVGPFIARQLIQRLVTSNPSRGYIYRVASKFNNNGSGVRGDLKAVVKAILLDPEARNPAFTQNVGFGKLREPLLRISHLLRAFNSTPPVPPDPRFFIDLQYSLTSQGPLKSPTVFNFFQPGYTPPGRIATAGLVAPEFQITSETTVISQTNLQNSIINSGISTREKNSAGQTATVTLDLAPYIGLLSREGFTAEQNQAALLDQLDVLLTSGQMSVGLRKSITDALSALPANFGTTLERHRDRVRMAIFIITASPEYSVQK